MQSSLDNLTITYWSAAHARVRYRGIDRTSSDRSAPILHWLPDLRASLHAEQGIPYAAIATTSACPPVDKVVSSQRAEGTTCPKWYRHIQKCPCRDSIAASPLAQDLLPIAEQRRQEIAQD